MELTYRRVDGVRAVQGVAFLHGILGRGENLGHPARGLVSACPEWSAWKVDLRGHGGSPKGTPNPNLESAARDVCESANRERMPLRAVVGHSFGGKVALEVARLGEVPSLTHVVVMDSVPGARAPVRGRDSALAILDMLQSLSRTFSSISEFTRAMEAEGASRDIAQWLAGSLERNGEQVRVALDLQEIRSMLLDYFARDLWPVVENPPDALNVHLIIGSRSDAYSQADRERAARIAASNKRVTIDLLPAGHWVHVDDYEGVLRSLVKHLCEGPS
ncbi:MAG TPA: alpha/beta hydrolase [Terriglobia bacterium]|nr:alpha/beta hydrolase [Terriglobia bacterium]